MYLEDPQNQDWELVKTKQNKKTETRPWASALEEKENRVDIMEICQQT